MTKIKHPNKTSNLDPEKCSNLHSELIKVFQKNKPTISEILIVYGNLGYSLGASIGGYTEQGPGPEELKKIYYSEPKRIDVALMLQGLMITEWLDSYEDK